MTLLPQRSFGNTKRTALIHSAAHKSKSMNTLVLMLFVLLFLISTFVHAAHAVIETINVEQQECHICHKGLDTPTELSQVQSLEGASYNFLTQNVVITLFKVSHFYKPQLRAPPLFQ